MKKITAIDIDNSSSNIEQEVNLHLDKFNRNRLRASMKKFKENLDADKPELSRNEYNKIRDEKFIELCNDEISEKTRKEIHENIKLTKENYNLLRLNINGLNELNEFSAECERQLPLITNKSNYNNFFEFIEQLKKCEIYSDKIKEIRKKSIDNYLNTFIGCELAFNYNIKKIYEDMLYLYIIESDTIDDLELYEKFNMLSNIDMSNQISAILNHSIVNNKNLSEYNKLFKNNKYRNINWKILCQLLLTTMNAAEATTSYVSNNNITCLPTTFSNNTNTKTLYKTRTIGELYLLISGFITDKYKKTKKEYRQQIYTSYDGIRPNNLEYYKWSGLQVFDIDLKSIIDDIDIHKIKQELFNKLAKYNWFLWVCISSSGKGIHIYTKVTPQHHIYTDVIDSEKQNNLSKFWFQLNYYSKVSIIYKIFKDIKYLFGSNAEDYYNNDELKFVDNTVARITSGIRLTYDEQILLNPNFIDLQIQINACEDNIAIWNKNEFNEPTNNSKIQCKLLLERLQSSFSELLMDDEEIKQKNKTSLIDISKYITLGYDAEKINIFPRSKINYVLRYNVCNTLASMMGKEGLDLAHHILQSTECNNVNEINSFYSTALTNNKKPTAIGLEALKKAGVIKSVEPELKEFVDNKFKSGIKQSIISVLNNKPAEYDYTLSDKQYLSDIQEDLLRKQDMFDGINIIKSLNDKNGKSFLSDKINIILSPAGSGKTSLIKNLAKQGDRVLLVLPYISVIKNKIETDPSVMELFDCYYGSKNIKDIEYGINAVTTIDKFSRANYEKISRMFKYIFIDESHLLFTSSYRSDATSKSIKRIKDLFYISQNDPTAAKLILMTGTETGESYFFNDVANIIRVDKPSIKKDLEFIICDDTLDCITRMSLKVVEYIKNGMRVMMPTNKGNEYSEKIISMVQYLLGRNIKYGYYKRENLEQEICTLINKYATVGDYEVIFCSNYLSVGVDITDTFDFASVYFGDFTGYEIEQFNARIRKKGITCSYFIKTLESNGEINPYLIEEPPLYLKLTDEEKLEYCDDKHIANLKTEVMATYDPVTRNIVTPGFSVINGKIMFDPEKYELIKYEDKYNECMEHPVKIARELDKYGYKITVSSDYEGLDIEKQEELKAIGLEGARNEKIKKHSIIIGTYLDLFDINTYQNKYGLECNNIIDYIYRHLDDVIEDREMEKFVDVKFSEFATPSTITVKNKHVLDDIIKSAIYLINKYSTLKAKQLIMEFVDENGIINKKKLKRTINLLKIVDASDNNELGEPTTKIIEKIYDFVDNFEIDRQQRISYNNYQALLAEWTTSFIDNAGLKIRSETGYKKIQDSIVELLLDIATKSTSKAGLRFTYNKIPDQDSQKIVNRRSIDTLIQRMFQIESTDSAPTNLQIRKTHIVLPTTPNY